MCFQIKVIKSGRCHYLGLRRIPWGNFRGDRLCLRLIFMSFHNLFTSHTLLNSLLESLCLWKNLYLLKNQKRKKVLGKKKRKTVPKKRERVPFCRKRKNTFVKATGTGRAPTLTSRFRTKKSPSNKNCHT